jgi:hypothetical protein
MLEVFARKSRPSQHAIDHNGRNCRDRRLPGAGAEEAQRPRPCELDWIVMKSLEKDRARRYETANGLAMTCGVTWTTRRCKRARRRRSIASASSRGGISGHSRVRRFWPWRPSSGLPRWPASTILVSRANQGLSESVERSAGRPERREAYFQRITVAHRELSKDNLAATLRHLTTVRKTCASGNGIT